MLVCEKKDSLDLELNYNISATCVLIKHGDLMVANLGDGRAVASVHNMAKQLTQVR